MITQTDNTAAAIVLVLDEQGPLPFADLFRLANFERLEPATFHDVLNTLLAEGALTLAPTGFYLAKLTP